MIFFVFIQLLSQIPDFNIVNVAASEKSAGKRYEDAVTWHQTTPIPEDIRDMKIVNTDPNEVSGFIFYSGHMESFSLKIGNHDFSG